MLFGNILKLLSVFSDIIIAGIFALTLAFSPKLLSKNTKTALVVLTALFVANAAAIFFFS